jgi:maltose-binding protein MalE
MLIFHKIIMKLLRFQLRGITPALSALNQNASVSSSIVASAEIATMEYASFPQPTIREMNRVWGPIGVLGVAFANGQVTPYNVKEHIDALIVSIG